MRHISTLVLDGLIMESLPSQARIIESEMGKKFNLILYEQRNMVCLLCFKFRFDYDSSLFYSLQIKCYNTKFSKRSHQG